MNTPRSPDLTEDRAIAAIWWRSWHDAHAGVVPRELVELRTEEFFLNRVREKINIIRVIGSIGKPVGMCYVVGEEMQQLFVSSSARGTGVAASLLEEAEHNLRNSNVKTAWLACAIGNARAEQFYKKHGWSNVGKMIKHFDVGNRSLQVEAWKYEKEM